MFSICQKNILFPHLIRTPAALEAPPPSRSGCCTLPSAASAWASWPCSRGRQTSTTARPRRPQGWPSSPGNYRCYCEICLCSKSFFFFRDAFFSMASGSPGMVLGLARSVVAKLSPTVRQASLHARTTNTLFTHKFILFHFPFRSTSPLTGSTSRAAAPCSDRRTLQTGLTSSSPGGSGRCLSVRPPQEGEEGEGRHRRRLGGGW